MKKRVELSRFNFWVKRVSKRFAHSAQAVLSLKGIVPAKTVVAGAGPCGVGQCNCGGGCNGECATSCEA
jgi:hypothetical protein